MKIRPMGVELLYTDGRTDRQTDMTMLTAAFRNFTNVPKNVIGVNHEMKFTRILALSSNITLIESKKIGWNYYVARMGM
jgi:hypothetical protein